MPAGPHGAKNEKVKWWGGGFQGEGNGNPFYEWVKFESYVQLCIIKHNNLLPLLKQTFIRDSYYYVLYGNLHMVFAFKGLTICRVHSSIVIAI